MTGVAPQTRIRAWNPAVAGIAEVFHASFAEHAYPVHTHDTWDLLILDDGAIDFALDRHQHGVAGHETVVLLPPGVPHDGRSVAAIGGFRKRVLYLDTSVLPEQLAGGAVDLPVHTDGLLRTRIHQLHLALERPGETLEAETRLAFVRERLLAHLDPSAPISSEPPPKGPAAALRELLDARLVEGITLAEAAALLEVGATHLIRSFTRVYGLPPHRYLTGRRIDRARRLLLAGEPPATVAATVGFYDESHLSRHFTRYLGIPPGRYARLAH